MKQLKRAVKGVGLLVLCVCFALIYVHPLLIPLSLTFLALFIWLVIRPASIENSSKRLKHIYYALELLSSYAWSIVLEIPFSIFRCTPDDRGSDHDRFGYPFGSCQRTAGNNNKDRASAYVVDPSDQYYCDNKSVYDSRQRI